MHVNTLTVSVGPCFRCLALTQDVHSHLHTWADMHEHTGKSTCSSVATKSQRICQCLYCSVTCDWMRAGCSHPVSRTGFISSCFTVWAPTICQKTRRENQPARQTDSQLDRKRSSKGVRGCLGWFMPMLRNAEWVQGTLLLWELTEWTLLSQWRFCILWIVIVKMSKCDVIAPYYSHMEFPKHREAARGNESL